MLVVLLVFSWCFHCDVTFKLINKLKVNDDNFKFNDDFKSHTTVERTLEEYLAFSII